MRRWSMQTKIQTGIAEDILSKYRFHPLSLLKNDEDFKRDLIGTGENQSLLMVRRYSFRAPKVFINVSPNKEKIEVGYTYGISGRVSLITVFREVYEKRLDDDKRVVPFATIRIGSEEQHLADLEAEINTLFKTKGFVFPEDIRFKRVKDFLTKASPYAFKLAIHIDTLGVYADVELKVMLSYIRIQDAIRNISDEAMRMNITKEDYSKTIYIMRNDNHIPLVQRYKQHVNRIGENNG